MLKAVALLVGLVLVTGCDNGEGPQFIDPLPREPSGVDYVTGEVAEADPGSGDVIFGEEGVTRTYGHHATGRFFLPALPTTQACSILDGGIVADIDGPAMSQCRPAPIAIVQATVFSIARDLGHFWYSFFAPCDCSDIRSDCQMNAFASSASPGFIWYDDFLINQMTNGDSLVPLAYLMAHEAAHHVQFAHNLTYMNSISAELSADCMAGYFLGYLACTGQVDGIDIDSSLGEICAAGDLPGTPWWDENAHGTCTQRVTAALDGIAGYALRVPPKEWCVW